MAFLRLASLGTTVPLYVGSQLTHLSINGNAWWSLAFEAFGEDDYLIDNLQTVAHWVFKNYSGWELQFEDSYAYPMWLSFPEISGITLGGIEVPQQGFEV